MCKRITRADPHQSLIRERPLCPVPSSTVRSVSAWSPKPLLVLSSSKSVVQELAQAFSGQQLVFRQEFVSELLHFSILSSQSGTLPFEDFSMLLEEIAYGSFSGLIATPPTSTWSRASNNKLLSSKYPLSALLMEFGEQPRRSGARPDVRWALREANREADRLANGDSSGFNPALRLRELPPVGGWILLDDALVLGETAENEMKKFLAEAGSSMQVKGKRKKPEDRLRLKDPW